MSQSEVHLFVGRPVAAVPEIALDIRRAWPALQRSKARSVRRAHSARYGIALALAAVAPAALAADWSNTNAQVLTGSSYEVGAPDRSILTLEHASGWAYGDNFFFFDVTNPDQAGTALYGEFAPRLSLGKVSGSDLSFGPIQDVLLAAQLNSGTDFRAWLFGAGIDLKLPGFAFFQLNAYARDDVSLPGTTWQLTAVGLVPIDLGGAKLSLGGFVDYAGAEGTGKANVLVVPQFLLDLGALWGAPGHFHAGVEYSYWKNKFGDRVTERVAQPMIRCTF